MKPNVEAGQEVYKIVKSRGIQRSCCGVERVYRPVKYKPEMESKIGKTIFLAAEEDKAALHG